MKKNKSIIVLFVIIVGISIGAFYYFYVQNENNSDKQNNYEATRTSTNDENNTNTNDINNSDSKENSLQDNNKSTEAAPPPPPTETNLASFTTKIYTKDSARQNNINITCNSLNNTIIKNGETFSFSSTVGPATTAKGYKKADIFDKNGNKKKGLRWW